MDSSHIATALKALITSSSRGRMVNKALPVLEEFATIEQPKRMYLGGSFASSKPNPGDLDIYAVNAKRQPWKQGGSAMEEKLFNADINMNRPTTFNDPNYKTAWKYAKEKYGPSYKWIRLLTPVATAINALMSVETFDPVSKYLQVERVD